MLSSKLLFASACNDRWLKQGWVYLHSFCPSFCTSYLLFIAARRRIKNIFEETGPSVLMCGHVTCCTAKLAVWSVNVQPISLQPFTVMVCHNKCPQTPALQNGCRTPGTAWRRTVDGNWGTLCYVIVGLDASERLRKVTDSFVMSVRLCVCPPAWNSRATTGWRIFMKFGTWKVFENLRENSVFIKIWQGLLVICIETYINTHTHTHTHTHDLSR